MGVGLITLAISMDVWGPVTECATGCGSVMEEDAKGCGSVMEEDAKGGGSLVEEDEKGGGGSVATDVSMKTDWGSVFKFWFFSSIRWFFTICLA